MVSNAPRAFLVIHVFARNLYLLIKRFQYCFNHKRFNYESQAAQAHNEKMRSCCEI